VRLLTRNGLVSAVAILQIGGPFGRAGGKPQRSSSRVSKRWQLDLTFAGTKWKFTKTGEDW
jgi:hypothetical protein